LRYRALEGDNIEHLRELFPRSQVLTQACLCDGSLSHRPWPTRIRGCPVAAGWHGLGKRNHPSPDG
jgi:hypothetical protein